MDIDDVVCIYTPSHSDTERERQALSVKCKITLKISRVTSLLKISARMKPSDLSIEFCSCTSVNLTAFAPRYSKTVPEKKKSTFKGQQIVPEYLFNQTADFYESRQVWRY